MRFAFPQFVCYIFYMSETLYRLCLCLLLATAAFFCLNTAAAPVSLPDEPEESLETVFPERFHDEVSRTFAHSPEPVEIEFSPIPGLAAFQLQSVRIPVELPVSGYRFPIPLRR